MRTRKLQKSSDESVSHVTVKNNVSKEEKDLLLLIAYLKRAPKMLIDIFAPCLHQAKQFCSNKETINKSIKYLHLQNTEIWSVSKPQMQLLQNFMSMMQIKDINRIVIQLRKKFIKRSDTSLGRLIDEFKMYERTAKINLLHPQLQIRQKIAKESGNLDIGLKCKTSPQIQSFFYAEPRFISKLDQLNNFKQFERLQNSILMLQHNGDFLIGNKVYAIIKNTTFQIWQTIGNKYPFQKQQIKEKSIHSHHSQYQEEDDDDITETDSFIYQAKPTLQLSFTFVGHSSKITCASFSNDQYYIITGSTDRTVKLWCLRLNIVLATYRSHMKTVWDVSFNPSGYFFLSGSGDGVMALWRTDRPFPQRLFLHEGDVYKVAFAKNPSIAISAGEDGCINLWQILLAQKIQTIKLFRPVININLGHTGQYLISIQSDGRVTVHNLLKGIIMSTFYHYSKKRNQNPNRKIIHDACLSQDQKELICTTKDHILKYKMEAVLRSKSTMNIYDNHTKEDKFIEHHLQPYDGIVINKHGRLDGCHFQNHSLLVVSCSNKL